MASAKLMSTKNLLIVHMTYTNVIDACEFPSFLIGKVIHAFYVEYTSVALLLDGGEVVNFATAEVNVGKWFEVFPIRLIEPPQYEFVWKELKKPFLVAAFAQLWREEWLEPLADDGSFMGAGPHHAQFAEPIGSAPASASQVVKVHAGIKLSGHDERCIVVCSSDNSPYKIDFALDEQDAERILKNHTFQ